MSLDTLAPLSIALAPLSIAQISPLEDAAFSAILARIASYDPRAETPQCHPEDVFAALQMIWARLQETAAILSEVDELASALGASALGDPDGLDALNSEKQPSPAAK